VFAGRPPINLPGGHASQAGRRGWRLIQMQQRFKGFPGFRRVSIHAHGNARVDRYRHAWKYGVQPFPDEEGA